MAGDAPAPLGRLGDQHPSPFLVARVTGCGGDDRRQLLDDSAVKDAKRCRESKKRTVEWRSQKNKTRPETRLKYGDAFVALRRKARGLGDELRQGVVIFRHRGAYTKTVPGWQLADFGLQLATLYLLLVAFGFGAPTLVSVVLIRTAQRVTVSLPGFLEAGSQQAMIVAILSQVGFPAGQAFGFGLGSKLTISGLTVALALIAARIMMGPLHLGTRIGERVTHAFNSVSATKGALRARRP